MMASTIGVSHHPFTMNKHIVTTEFNSYLSDNAGKGINARYMQRLNDKVSVEAGFGFTDGDRAACIVAACGIPINKIRLIGFRSDKIGRWTGITDPVRKLRKLKWMEAVLDILRGTPF
jgi:hypothetical protein